jgi:nucleoside-diphosphate-sugar epimerase
MQPTVLILGARGRFGLAAARAFANAGWKVLGQMRPGAQVPAEASNDSRIQWLTTDLHDTASLTQAAAGAAVVVHALNPAYTHKAWKAQVLPMTEAATEVARALHATLMVPGNVYNFGEDMPAVLREDTPQVARTIKGRIRIGMEEQLQRSGVRTVVIRAGDFFGAGKGTWFDQVIVKDLQKGVFTYPGGKDVATAWAYLPDLARTFVAVAAKRAQLPAFEVLHFAGYSITGQQWLNVLSPVAQRQDWVRQGAELRFSDMPWPLIRLGALLVPTWEALAEMRYLWRTPHALANDKLLALLGREPHTPLAQAAQTALVDLGFISVLTGAPRHAAT